MKTYCEVPSIDRRTLSVICDRCKTAFETTGEDWPDMGEVSCYTHDGLTIEDIAKGREHIVQFDICKPCFFSWLMPLFAAQGVEKSQRVKVEASGATAE